MLDRTSGANVVVRIPAEHYEIGVGAMLVLLGAWSVQSARRVRDGEPHPNHERSHRGVTLVGFFHGLAGTSAVVVLVPLTLLDRVAAGLGYLAAFGIGVTAAMTLYAMAAAVAMRRAADRSRVWGARAAMGVGAAAMAIGVIWMARAWTA